MLGIKFTEINSEDKQKIAEHVHFYMLTNQ